MSLWNYRGVAAVSFISIVTACCVLGTCGWILIANEFYSFSTTNTAAYASSTSPQSPEKVGTSIFPQNTHNRNFTQQKPSNSKRNFRAHNLCESFQELFLRCCAIAVVISSLQGLTSIYLLLASPVTSWRQYGNIWLWMNMFLNITYLLIIIFPATQDSPLKDESDRMISNIRAFSNNILPDNQTIQKTCGMTHLALYYTHAYYIALGITCVTHYLLLISIMLLLKYDPFRFRFRPVTIAEDGYQPLLSLREVY